MHTTSGSVDINERGELFLEFILKSNLVISNSGSVPTFITKSRKEVLDMTFFSKGAEAVITNWRVPDKHSFSAHRYIQFDLNGVPSMLSLFRNHRNADWHKYPIRIYIGWLIVLRRRVAGFWVRPAP